jgi:eukaryotic-like serine/threonine-protein kinase
MKGERLILTREWVVGDRVGEGGFGRVFALLGGDSEAVAKFVPKAPGADRELLFVDLADIRNIVPIIDTGEHGDHWVLVMPRAEESLRDRLERSELALDVTEVIEALTDITEALVDLEGRVVHRDIKPENILRLGGRWCLADFGISRYAEATTSSETQKFALSPPYAAPERWRHDRATSATDVYAVGIIAYEMVGGRRPFPGPLTENFRDQHLHDEPPALPSLPAALAALIEECLYKAPAARPTPANLLVRLGRVSAPPPLEGLARLQEANRAEVARRSEASRKQSAALTAAERRSSLFEAAKRSFERISSELREAISSAAPSAQTSAIEGRWSIKLNQATLSMSQAIQRSGLWGGWEPPAFDIIASAELNLRIPTDRTQWEGRSHSLWFGDVIAPDNYGWFEAAFMYSPFVQQRGRQNPFALDPGEEAAKALWSGMAEFQLAWPFTPLVVGELDDLINRWASWFAEAAEGRLGHPSSMPERSTQGSWRRN